MNKSEIRRKILKIRKQNNTKNLKIDFKDIFKILKQNRIKSIIIGGYYPYNNEVDSIEILKKFEELNYNISLPKIKKNFQMNFFHWSIKDPLSINKYGIPEPTSNIVTHPNILLVPLVAFDNHFNRIGYGGGYYDRTISFLEKKRNIITIGVAFDEQQIEKVPTMQYDKKLNYIITQTRIIE